MAGLTTRDGMPPPGDLPDGWFRSTRVPGGRIRIDQADPRILISGELLDIMVRWGDTGPAGDWLVLNARLDTSGCAPPPWRATYVGAVLRIDGVNRTVIYRITEYVPRINGYIGEWPD